MTKHLALAKRIGVTAATLFVLGALGYRQPLVGNATHLRNLYHAGLWDPAPMVNDLRDHKYAIVILDAELYPEPVLVAIGQFYFLDRTVQLNGATYHIFLPGAQ